MKTFQTGGSIGMTYLANPFSPEAKQSQNASTASTTKTSEKGLVSKELLNKLSGIPVDVDHIYDMISKLETEESMGLPVNKRAIHQIESNINRAIQFSKYLDNAEKEATKNDALGEIAVGERGQLYTLKDSKIHQVSITNYNIEKDGPALTINELIEHRKFNPNQAFDESVLKPISTNYGLSKINTYIQEIIKTVGESSTLSEAYVDIAGYLGQETAKRPTEEQFVALQQLNQLGKKIGMDAILKRKDLISSKNLDAALQYIQSVLPKPIKYQLMGRYVADGGNFTDSSEIIKNLIGSALISSNDYKTEHLIDYDASINKAAGTQAGAKEQNRNLGALEQLVQGSLGKRDYQLRNSKNSDLEFSLHGTGIGSLASIDGDIVDKTPLSVALSAGLAPLVDKQHITLGNQKINSGVFDTILYDGGDVINIWAPVDRNGDIDLNQLQTLSAIQEICDSNPNLTTEDKNNMLKEYGLSGYFDEQGTFHGSGNMAQFLVMTGLTSEKIVDDSTNLFVDKLSRDEKQYAFEQIDRIYGQLNKNLKAGKYEFKTGLFKGSTDLYRAPIFMKLNTTAQIDVGTFSGRGPMVQTPSYAQQMAYDQMRYTQQNQNLIQPLTSALYE